MLFHVFAVLFDNFIRLLAHRTNWQTQKYFHSECVQQWNEAWDIWSTSDVYHLEYATFLGNILKLAFKCWRLYLLSILQNSLKDKGTFLYRMRSRIAWAIRESGVLQGSTRVPSLSLKEIQTNSIAYLILIFVCLLNVIIRMHSQCPVKLFPGFNNIVWSNDFMLVDLIEFL